MTDGGLANHHASEKRSQGHGGTEDSEGTGGDCHREDQHGEGEKFAGPQTGNLCKHPRNDPRAGKIDHAHQGDQFDHGQRNGR